MAIVHRTSDASDELMAVGATIYGETASACEELLRVAQYLLNGIASGECSRGAARNAIWSWAEGDGVLVERAARNATAAGFPVEARLLAESCALRRAMTNQAT